MPQEDYHENVYEFGTHAGLLYYMLAGTVGDVLEIGSGLISTPMLHGLLLKTKRKLLTVEEHPTWFMQASGAMKTEMHGFAHVLDWEKFYEKTLPQCGHFGVALVDHGLTHLTVTEGYEERKRCVRTLVDQVDVIILHDINDDEFIKDEAWNAFVGEFKYAVVDDMYLPATLAVSNVVDVTKLVPKWTSRVRPELLRKDTSNG